MATLRSRLIEVYLSDGLRDLHRSWHRVRRGKRRRVLFVHQVDDPYSVLLAQVVHRLLPYVDVQIVLMPAPTEQAAPDADRLRGWAMVDAAGLAQQHGLRFCTHPRRPTPENVARAQRIGLPSGPVEERLERLVALGLRLLSGGNISGEGPAPTAALEANRARVLKAGHYQGGMLAYEGEWYWGLDRLPLLVHRLRDEGVPIEPILDPGALPTPRPANGDTLEWFFSFRSPYSYLSIDRTIEMADRLGLALRVRPVLPMVMRGLPVPWVKRKYLVTDCRRLATRLNLPFGRIADPVGAGVERALAVVPYAREQGLLVQWVRSCGTGVWSEGLDLASDRDLAVLAVKAGLDPEACLLATHDDSWRAEAEANRQALLDLGLWGVPSYRIGELCVWGQDRLDLIERSVRGQEG